MAKHKFVLLIILLTVVTQLIAFTIYNYTNYTINNRMFFGLFGSNIISLLLQSFLLGLIFLVIINKKYYQIATAFIISGLTSNLIDRIIFGGVRDYIKIIWWPSFNIPDILIISGLLVLIKNYIRENKII